ncbi:hypothetical protein A2U01_0054305, partial [Trifolium medium]|nr:hypothetical protein [Trifolium medium]
VHFYIVSELITTINDIVSHQMTDLILLIQSMYEGETKH